MKFRAAKELASYLYPKMRPTAYPVDEFVEPEQPDAVEGLGGASDAEQDRSDGCRAVSAESD